MNKQKTCVSIIRTKKATERVAIKKNVLAFESIRDKVRNCQTDFIKKWEAVKTELPPEEREYKLICVVKDSEGQLLTKPAQKLRVRCPQENLEQFKKDMHIYIQNNLNLVLNTFDQLKNAAFIEMGDGSKCQEEFEKKLKNTNAYALDELLNQINSFELCDEPKETPTVGNDELEVKIARLLKQIDELQKNLDQNQKELDRIKKMEEDKTISFKKELEEKDKKLNKNQLECDELKKKIESIEKNGTEDKAALKDFQEKINNKTTEVEDLKNKLKVLQQTNITQQNENKDKNTKIKKLETDLKAALKNLENRAEGEQSIGDQDTRHTDEVETLKRDLWNSQKENRLLEKEVQQLRTELVQDGALDIELLIFKEKFKQQTDEIATLRQNIKDLENKLQSKEGQISYTKTVSEELAKLQNATAEKDAKIDILEMQLTKVHFQNQKLAEKIAMDRKLLKVRCSLIESLQTKENIQKIQLEDLYVEMDERNNDIQMLKADILTKTEEFQNLFASFSAKQLEVTRMEHKIKLMQESNERTQTLRVRHEAKIGRLQEEVTQLKQTLSLYRGAMLANDALRNNLLLTEATGYNDCSEKCMDAGHRKTHIDISLKNYQK